MIKITVISRSKALSVGDTIVNVYLLKMACNGLDIELVGNPESIRCRYRGYKRRLISDNYTGKIIQTGRNSSVNVLFFNSLHGCECLFLYRCCDKCAVSSQK